MESTPSLLLEYDAMRGGFAIFFGSQARDNARPIFAGMLEAFFSSGERLSGVECLWDRGGLPLRKLTGGGFGGGFYGDYSLPLQGPIAKYVEYEETGEAIALWFGDGWNLKVVDSKSPLPLGENWKLRSGTRTAYRDPLGITLWFSGLRRVAGIEFAKPLLEEGFFVEEISVHDTDFK